MPACELTRRVVLLGAAASTVSALARDSAGRSGGVMLPTEEVCVSAPATPFDPASGLAPLAARPVPAAARCPVCGMYPARQAGWLGQLIYRDGDAHFFDTPGDLQRFLADVPRHARGRTRSDVAVMWRSPAPGGAWLPLAEAELRALPPGRHRHATVRAISPTPAI